MILKRSQQYRATKNDSKDLLQNSPYSVQKVAKISRVNQSNRCVEPIWTNDDPEKLRIEMPDLMLENDKSFQEAETNTDLSFLNQTSIDNYSSSRLKHQTNYSPL